MEVSQSTVFTGKVLLTIAPQTRRRISSKRLCCHHLLSFRRHQSWYLPDIQTKTRLVLLVHVTWALGCVIDSIGIVLKYFRPRTETIWPLYTLFILAGWTIYAPAQLLVLYSRLHLVNQNRRTRRWVLIMIISLASLMIIPSWPLSFQAHDPYNHHLSAIYSPREAIMDRISQIGYTVAECVLSGVYICSLVRLLNLKSDVRQRRVMTDLIYVNIVAVCLDVLTVVMVFLNQTGISHPVQCFSYIIKLKLEFMVLNQLMAVAARGLRRESFAERRYHQLAKSEDSSAMHPQPSRGRLESLEEVRRAESVRKLVTPSPTLFKSDTGPHDMPLCNNHDHEACRDCFRQVKSRTRDAIEGAEEDDIGVHMWESRGKLVLEVPWFKKPDIA